jgi:hypothetical protein
MFADDFVVATQAEVPALDPGGTGRRAGGYADLYGGEPRQATVYTRRCAYPRCTDEAAARCGACKRLYCAAHCSYVVFGPTGKYQECDLCQQHVTLDSVDDYPQRGPVAAVGAIVVLLAVVSAGNAIDVATGGRGVVTFLTFCASFVAFVLYVL